MTAIKRLDTVEQMKSQNDESRISDYRDTDPRRIDQVISQASEIYIMDNTESSTRK